MKIFKINQGQPQPEMMRNAAEVLINRGVVIHPTETVYGLAGFYNDIGVIYKINRIKNRKPDQPFSIMVNSLDELFHISGYPAISWLENFLNEFLPGPLTVLLPRKKSIEPSWWNQFPEVGFRFPAHILSHHLIDYCRSPLITTSANRSGEPPAAEVKDIPEELQDQANLVLDGGITKEKEPSTIIRINTEAKQLVSIRKGCIPFLELEKKFEEFI